MTHAARILLVDDFEQWRKYVCSVLKAQPGLEVVGEASDGLEAVHRAEEVQPDLILLDVGLPNLNGIEAARLIREVAPESKILFLSENRSSETAAAALSAGGNGYVVKSDCARELVAAIEAVLHGKQFFGRTLRDRDSCVATEAAVRENSRS